jgi:glycosyltransferase involved in cell wall biosynthesis
LAQRRAPASQAIIDTPVLAPTLPSQIVKILVLTNLYPPHHAGTYDVRCQTLVDALKTRGHQLHVLTSTQGIGNEQRGGEVERRFHLNGAFGQPLVSGYGELKQLELLNHRALQETVAAFAPEVIHVHSLEGMSKSLIFALQNLRIPVVYSVDSYWLAREVSKDPWLRWWNNPKASALQNLARFGLEFIGQRTKLDARAPTRASRADHRIPALFTGDNPLNSPHPNTLIQFRFEHIYFCSQTVKYATESAGFRVAHGEVIYPGVPTETFFGEVKPASAPISKFLVVCRLDGQSGVLTAIKALRALRGRGGSATLSVYGRGDSEYIASIRSEVAAQQLPVEFIAVGNVTKELPAIYRRHDALIYSAEWNEPFSVTPLEAMASGLPVIGSSIGGAGELFRDEQNALTYAPGDSEMLASRIQQLQQETELRCQAAEAAQQEVLSQYNESTVTDRVEAYLQSALGEKPE